MVLRKYQWKLQIRRNEKEAWRDDGQPPKFVEIPNYKTRSMEKVPNSFNLDLEEGQPVPEKFYGIPGGRSDMVYEARTVLESIDAGGNRFTHLINYYEKVDPRRPWIPAEGIAYLTCKIDECGEKIAPGRETQHLIEKHEKRLKYIKEIDLANTKFFDVHIVHGRTVTEVRNINQEPKIKR